MVDGIAELGSELGVEYRTGSEVTAIRGSAGDFRVELASGQFLRSDLVVSDADYAHTEQELLPPEKRQNNRPASPLIREGSILPNYVLERVLITAVFAKTGAPKRRRTTILGWVAR